MRRSFGSQGGSASWLRSFVERVSWLATCWNFATKPLFGVGCQTFCEGKERKGRRRKKRKKGGGCATRFILRMDHLLKQGAQLGLTPNEVTSALRFGRPLSESNWCNAVDMKEQALEGAKESFEAGRYLEYQCYDDEAREQGRAVVTLRGWEDISQGLLNADHALASDGYYAWYMDHDVKDKGIYHICSCCPSLPSKACSRR